MMKKGERLRNTMRVEVGGLQRWDGCVQKKCKVTQKEHKDTDGDGVEFLMLIVRLSSLGWACKWILPEVSSLQ